MKRLLLALIFTSACWAVQLGPVVAASTYEVRTTGTDTNGGGFVTGASGTDYSQNNNKNATSCTSCGSSTVNLSVTDLVATGVATITSATANFSAAAVGNIGYLTGTGLTTGWYEIVTFTNSTTVILDRSPGTGTGGTINIGGALLTWQTAFNIVTASNRVWIQTGSYSKTSTTTFPSGITTLPNVTPIVVLGYNTSRGDAPTGSTRPTLTTSTSSIVLLTVPATQLHFENLIFAGNSNANTCISVTAVDDPERGLEFTNVSCTNYKTSGILVAGADAIPGPIFNWVEVTGGAASCTGDVVAASNGSVILSNVYVHASACPGITQNTNNSSFIMTRVVSAKHTSANGHGFVLNGALANSICDSCIGYANAGDEFQVTGSYQAVSITNSIFWGTTGTCLNFGFSMGPASLAMNFNGVGGCSTARTNVVAGSNDVPLTADPFTNGAAGDFSLNSTTGGGAALKSVGYPGVFPGGTSTGYNDIGAIRHQDPAGGSSTTGSVQ